MLGRQKVKKNHPMSPDLPLLTGLQLGNNELSRAYSDRSKFAKGTKQPPKGSEATG
jgi:hypothetical protein